MPPIPMPCTDPLVLLGASFILLLDVRRDEGLQYMYFLLSAEEDDCDRDFGRNSCTSFRFIENKKQSSDPK